MIDEIKKALAAGKIVALEEDGEGKITVRVYDNDRESQLDYCAGADKPEKLVGLPQVFFINQEYQSEHFNQI